MADQPDLDKVVVLEAEIVELKGKIEALEAELREQLSARDQKIAALEAGDRALRDEALLRDQEIAALHEGLVARDRLNEDFAKHAEHERARAGQAAAAAVRDLAATTGSSDRDDGALPQNVIEVFRMWVQDGMEITSEFRHGRLRDALRWLKRALDENHPPSDKIAAAVMVAFHWGKWDRGWLSRQVEWLREGEKSLRKFHRETPKRLGSLKRGKTKRDPAKVAAYYEDLIESGTCKQVAREMTREKFEISDKTLRGYLRTNCKS